MFLNPTPKPIEIPISLFKNLFTGKKHVVILSQPLSRNIEMLLNAVNSGLKIKVNKVFPFTQSIEAYRFAEKGGVIGKVAIEIN
nr:zinc-binding dehydrogenase [Olivibacter sp. XZL3]